MNRLVERTRNLPAFSIGLGELEVLWNRMIAAFSPDKPEAFIKISLRSETLEFRTLDEFRNYAEIKGRVTKFSLHFYQGSRILSVFPRSRGKAYVFAQGETEVWPAGAVELVYSLIQSHRLWYGWFISTPVNVLIFILTVASSAAVLLTPKSAFPRWIVFGWLSILLAFSALQLATPILFPSSVLRITNEESFFRRHAAELTLVVALLALVVSVVGLFLSKK